MAKAHISTNPNYDFSYDFLCQEFGHYLIIQRGFIYKLSVSLHTILSNLKGKEEIENSDIFNMIAELDDGKKNKLLKTSLSKNENFENYSSELDNFFDITTKIIENRNSILHSYILVPALETSDDSFVRIFNKQISKSIQNKKINLAYGEVVELSRSPLKKELFTYLVAQIRRANSFFDFLNSVLEKKSKVDIDKICFRSNMKIEFDKKVI